VSRPRKELQVTSETWQDQHGNPQYVHSLARRRVAAQVLATHDGVVYLGHLPLLEPEEALQVAKVIEEAAREVMGLREGGSGLRGLAVRD